MSAMTQERQEQRPAPPKRPVSGIAIDPDRLTWWRESRGWSRQDLADAITALNLTDDDGSPLTVSRDAIAKNETGAQPGGRKPKARTVRAYCAALSRPGDPCTPRDLLPGGPPLPPHENENARRSRLDYNRDLRIFAREHGIRYKNPVSGRVYYSRPLRDAYELMVSGADDEVLGGAIAEAVAARPAEADEEEIAPICDLTGDDEIGELDLTVRTHNALLRGDLSADSRPGAGSIRTIGELISHDAESLRRIRNFGPASLAEVRDQLSAAGFALAGETVPGLAGGCDGTGTELLAS